MSEEKKVFLISVDLLNPKTLFVKLSLLEYISVFFFNCGLKFLLKMGFFSNQNNIFLHV